MKIVFDTKAVHDLQNIRDWIAQDSPDRSAIVIDRIFKAIRGLSILPSRPRPGRRPGTRELLIPRFPYLVVYERDEQANEIRIVAVFHMAQDRPDR